MTGILMLWIQIGHKPIRKGGEEKLDRKVLNTKIHSLIVYNHTLWYTKYTTRYCCHFSEILILIQSPNKINQKY